MHKASVQAVAETCGWARVLRELTRLEEVVTDVTVVGSGSEVLDEITRAVAIVEETATDEEADAEDVEVVYATVEDVEVF